MKKYALLIVLLVSTYFAFGQMMYGVCGSFPQTSINQYNKDSFYGVFSETVLKNIGIGDSIRFNSNLDIDLNVYLSYHFFGASFPFDIFLQAGAGLISSVNATFIQNNSSHNFEASITSTPYIFPALGTGVYLGNVGFDVKVAYDYPLPYRFTAIPAYLGDFPIWRFTFDLVLRLF
jgi:hypothetical protein